MISQANDYAVRSLIFLSQQPPGHFIPAKIIARNLKIPAFFLAKILQKLARKKIVLTARGPRGGLTLNKKVRRLTLREIFATVDGVPIIRKCVYDKKFCTLKMNCNLCFHLVPIQHTLERMLARVTIADLTPRKAQNKPHRRVRR